LPRGLAARLPLTRFRCVTTAPLRAWLATQPLRKAAAFLVARNLEPISGILVRAAGTPAGTASLRALPTLLCERGFLFLR
jgi:hypothetical protein